MRTLPLAIAITLLAVASPAAANPTDWTAAVAPRVGAVVPTSNLGPFVVGGLEIDVFLPVLNKQLVVAIDGTFTQPSYEGTVTDSRVGGAQSYTISSTQLKLSLDCIYRFSPGSATLVPFAGLGIGMLSIGTSQESAFQPAAEGEDSTEFGFELLGGADYKMGPGFLFGEARFGYAGMAHRLTGDAGATNITVSAGYRIGF